MYQKGKVTQCFYDIVVFDIVYSSKQPIVFADDEETVLLHYGRPSLTGAIMEERSFEFDR